MNENDIIFEKYKDRITGGKSDGKTCEDIANKHGVSLDSVKKQMKMGKKVEMEHTNSTDMAEEISRDHLWEFPNYYAELDKMETKLKKRWEKA